MKFGFSTLEPADYIDILLRRKWIILICLMVGLGGAGVTFKTAPRIYESSTLIMVESQKVPMDVVRPVVVDTIAERLATIKQQILSRTLLKKIIDEFGLYPEAMANREPLEDIVAVMREDIRIATVGKRGSIQAFSIAYQGEIPKTVQGVTNKLASLFIEENLKVREQLIEGTTSFLHQELRRVEDQINRKEKELSEYKQRYMGSLPDQAEANLRTLDRLQLERQRVSETLSMLDERREIFNAARAYRAGQVPDGPVGPLDMPIEGVDDSQGGPAVHLQQLQQALTSLQADYTDSYPEVIRVKRQIAELVATLYGEAAIPTDGEVDEEGDEASGEDGVDGPKPVAVVKAKPFDQGTRVRDSERRLIERRKQEIEKQSAEYERRVEEGPIHALALGNMERDYNNILRNYQSLLDKKLAAQVSENLEKRQKGERFRVVDPANFPGKPIKPLPLVFFAGGAAGGLLVACGLIAWLDFRVLPFRRPEQVEANLGLPILATIPRMTGVLGEDSTQKNGRFRLPRWRPKHQETVQAGLNALGTEQLRVLAGRVIRLQHQKGFRVLALTSAVAGEGKTMLATGLAVVLARDYLENIVLIDGDMINPGVSNHLGLHNGRGLMSVLEGECDLDAALYQDVRHPNLMILAAGVNGNGSQGLAAQRASLERLFAELKQRGVMVILDAPPLLAMADMHLYSDAVDCVMMVIRARQTAQSAVVQGLKFLHEAGGNVEGVVVNDLAALSGQEKPYIAKYSSGVPPQGS